jgi:ubiquitin C-terminal hydrolase
LSLDLVGDLGACFDLQQVQQLCLPPSSPKGGITLGQCLQEHTKEEVLDGGNEVYCGVCKEHRQMRKIVKFCRPFLPRILILSLKRFEFRNVSGLTGFRGAHREKIETFVDFPLDHLDLAPFCQAGLGESTDGSCVYDLFAVCNHYGRMGFGHYTAAARDQGGGGGEWHSFDDDEVSGPCSAEEVETKVHSKNAYILFYRQRT